MSVVIKVRGGTLAMCPSCGSEHLGGDCGTSALERYRSLTVDKSWMPAKKELGQLKNYYDKDALSDAFMGDEAEERVLDETAGWGHVTQADLAEAERIGGPEAVQAIADFYARDPEDSKILDVVSNDHPLDVAHLEGETPIVPEYVD